MKRGFKNGYRPS
jgi:hypothetical protein